MRAWPKNARANPIVVDFFTATKTTPSGDLTPWCAATVNWCILKSRQARADAETLLPITANASSGSFRRWGNAAVTFDPITGATADVSIEPKVGDVMVFAAVKNDGTPHAYQGHVGFFLDMDNSRIRVLGGNQFEGNPAVHAINVKTIGRGGSLRPHSVRTDSSLHL